MIFDSLQQQDIAPRTLYGCMAAILALTLLASWLYIFKVPLAEASHLRQTRELLQGKSANRDLIAGQIVVQAAEVNKLRGQVYGSSSVLPLNVQIAETIGILDRVSQDHQVRLDSVTPGVTKSWPLFEELPFATRVTGTYFQLYAWMQAMEERLRPMVIKRFSIRPTTGERLLAMEIEIVSYRAGEL